MTQEVAPETPRLAPLVSVIIPTFNRRVLLSRCLDALALQTLPPEQFEVIVVDDGSTDDTVSWVTERARTFLPRLTVLTQANAGPAAARNRGIGTAQAPVIAFTDDDAVPRPGWLVAALSAFEDPTISAVEGRVTAGEGAVIHLFDAYLLNETGEKFVTCNMFYRTVVLRTVGGFDERFREAFREDSDLAFHCLERGLTIKFVPDAVVDHPPRPAGWGKFIRQAWLYRYDGLLREKHPDEYAARIRRSVGWPQLVFVLYNLNSVFLIGLIHLVVALGGKADEDPLWLQATGALFATLWWSWPCWMGCGAWWVKREADGRANSPGTWTLAILQFPIMALAQCVAVLVGSFSSWNRPPRGAAPPS